MDRYPKLPGISSARPDPVLGEMVNYQTAQYALGSINHPYEASGCMVYASAWWNDSEPSRCAARQSQTFAALYPHYVLTELRSWTGRSCISKPSGSAAQRRLDKIARPVDA